MTFRSVLLWAAGAVLLRGSTIYIITDLGPFTGAAPVSNSNASGAIVSGDGHAIIVNGSSTIDLGVLPGGNWSAAYGINSAGDVAGYGNTSNSHFAGFVWTPSSGMTQLGTLGGLDSWAMAINDSGVIAGHSTTASGYIHAFESSGAGSLIDLGTLGGLDSYAWGINNAGAIAGCSLIAGGASHAFLYQNGSMLDLNSMIATNSGWVLNAAYSIDNAGDIVGTGLYDGATHEFRLTPATQSLAEQAGAQINAPEPSVFLLIGLGLCALGWLGWRNRAQGS